MKLFPAYMASFAIGARTAAQDRAVIFSDLVVYAVLLIMFQSIYKIMPVHELGMEGLTWHHLLWYFAITEGVIVSSPGLAAFGQMVANSELTGLMQRPTRVMGFVVARLAGSHLMTALLLLPLLVAFMVFFFGAPMTMPLVYAPLLVVSFILSVILFELLGYMLGTVEVFGPYSRSTSWIIGKFIFAFGGLFFPVIFFPDILQTIVWMTPFPAVIYIPASFMLMAGLPAMLQGIGIQLFWIVVVLVAAWLAERGMIGYVMERGD